MSRARREVKTEHFVECTERDTDARLVSCESCKRDMAQEASGAVALGFGSSVDGLAGSQSGAGRGHDTTSGYHSPSGDQNPCDLQGAVDGPVGAGDTLRAVKRCLHQSKCWLLDYPGSTTGKKRRW